MSLGPRATAVIQEPRVCLVSTVYQVLLGRKVEREIQVYLGHQGKMAPQD